MPNEFLVAADVSATGGTGFTADHRFLYNNGSGANAGDLFYDADGNGCRRSGVDRDICKPCPR